MGVGIGLAVHARPTWQASQGSFEQGFPTPRACVLLTYATASKSTVELEKNRFHSWEVGGSWGWWGWWAAQDGQW